MRVLGEYAGLWPYGRASVTWLYSWRKLSPCRFSYISCLQKLASKHLVVGQKRPTTI